MTNPNIDRAFRARNGFSLSDEVFIIYLENAPDISPGFDAPISSLALTTSGVFIKYDTGVLDWRKLSSVTSESFYWGAPDIDGTWRIILDNNDLLVQRRESETFISKVEFEGNTGGITSSLSGTESGQYIGDPETNGSFRIIRETSNLSIQRRESGSWVIKHELEDGDSTHIDVQTDDAFAMYITSNITNLHFRIIRETDNLVFEERISGSWKKLLEIEP